MYETGGQAKEKLKFIRWFVVILVIGLFLPKKFDSAFTGLGVTFLFAYYILMRPIILFMKGFMDGYRRKQ
jgi:low temperature requirement protein LtrA